MKKTLNSTYWQQRYIDKTTGWDLGTVSPPLKNYIDGLSDKSAKILVPGAGNGHEIEYLWNKGYKNCYALDIAKAPLENIGKRLKGIPKNQLLHSDFFEIDQTFDVILEQTFFCALKPNLRVAYVNKMNELLSPNGVLAGLLFQFPLSSDGPPYGGSYKEYKELFEHKFHIHKMETAYNSIKQREGKELFFIFEKKSS